MKNPTPASTLTQPSTPKGRATMARILAAGHEVFGSSGYVSMRMVDLAEKSGLSLGALYRYFDNKEDVFTAIIQGIHQQLYEASRANTEQKFATQPYETILRSNLGYLSHYCQYRHVMRAFVEATMVDKRYKDLWWYMRDAHIQRIAHAIARDHGVTSIGNQSVRHVLEALVSMTEQSAFVWFAVPQNSDQTLSPDEAAKIVTDIWFHALFR